jgi:hypothetical protein
VDLHLDRRRSEQRQRQQPHDEEWIEHTGLSALYRQRLYHDLSVHPVQPVFRASPRGFGAGGTVSIEAETDKGPLHASVQWRGRP